MTYWCTLRVLLSIIIDIKICMYIVILFPFNFRTTKILVYYEGFVCIGPTLVINGGIHWIHFFFVCILNQSLWLKSSVKWAMNIDWWRSFSRKKKLKMNERTTVAAEAATTTTTIQTNKSNSSSNNNGTNWMNCQLSGKNLCVSRSPTGCANKCRRNRIPFSFFYTVCDNY